MRVFAAFCLLLASADAAAIDTILHNGKVWTGDATMPAATAIATRHQQPADDGRWRGCVARSGVLKAWRWR